MTIIAVKNGVMAADSHTFSGGTHWPGKFPKITRGPDGLLGVAGPTNDCWIVSQWWLGGCKDKLLGELQKGDRGIAALILRPDGSVWFMDERLVPCPTDDPAVTGEPDAATFCEGALYAGLSAEEAVRLTIDHCKSAAGSVQVERWEPTT